MLLRVAIFLVIKFPLFKNHSRLSSNVTIIVTLDSAHHLESSLTPEQAVEKDIILLYTTVKKCILFHVHLKTHKCSCYILLHTHLSCCGHIPRTVIKATSFTGQTWTHVETTHWQAISHCDSVESLATLQKNDAVVHHVHSTLALLISSACQLQRVLCSMTEHRANKAVSRYPRSLTYFSEGISTFLLLR